MGSQTTDTITTQIDRARGALEMMPLSGKLLDIGGIGLLWTFKVLLAVSATAVLILAARAVRAEHPMSKFTYRVALVSVQVATVGLVWVSLNNTMLLGSLPS